MIFFVFSLSRPFPTYLGLKRIHNGFFFFFEIFYFFLEFSIPGRLGTHRNDFFLFSLFLGHSHPILAWKEVMMVFSNFSNFFGIIYYGLCRNTSEWFFFFLSFSAFLNLFWLEKKLWWCFLIFLIYLLFFWNFLLRVG